MKFITHTFALVIGMSLVGCAHSETQRVEVAGASGCSQLEEDGLVERVYSPGTIYAAKPIKKRMFYARANQPIRTVGAKLYMHAPQGVTSEYLQRRLACHAQGGQAAHPNDPLHPSAGSIASVSVEPSGGSYAIHVLSDSPKVGQEIWQRAANLSGSGDTSVQQVGAAPSFHADM